MDTPIFLINWVLRIVEGQARLYGTVYNHPEFQNGEAVVTSPIRHYDSNFCVAETQSGTRYILGSK